MGELAPNWLLVNAPRGDTPIEKNPHEMEPNHEKETSKGKEPDSTTSDDTPAPAEETPKPDSTSTTTTTTTDADKVSAKEPRTASDETEPKTSEILAPGTNGTTLSTQTLTGLLIYTGTIEPTSTSTSALTSTSISAPTDNSSADAGSSSSGIASTKTKIAIAVPVGVVGLAIILAFIILACRRSKRHQRANRSSYNVAQPTTSTLLPAPGSVSQLMAAPKLSTSEPSAVPTPQRNFSVPIAPQSRNASPRPVPAALIPGSARELTSASNQDLNIPAGVAAAGVAAPGQLRRSTSGPQRSYEAMRGPSPSSRSPPLPSPQPQSPPGASESPDPRFLLHRGQTQRSGVSDVSSREDGGERDLDDMSSVSSFDESSPRSLRSPTRFFRR